METSKQPKKSAKLDPIEWAIFGIVIAGTSLVLTIDTKIKARRKEKSEKAQRGNRLQLQEMKECLKEMNVLVGGFNELVNLRIALSEQGITRGSWEFVSEEAMEKFNRSFDRITYLVSRLNRCVNAFDPDGILLDEKVEREFIAGPITRLKENAEKAIQPSTDSRERLELVKSLLYHAEQLVATLEQVLR